MWFCCHCRISMPGMQKVLNRVAKLEQGQSEILEKLDVIQSHGNEVAKPNVEELIKEALNEQKEI